MYGRKVSRSISYFLTFCMFLCLLKWCSLDIFKLDSRIVGLQKMCAVLFLNEKQKTHTKTHKYFHFLRKQYMYVLYSTLRSLNLCKRTYLYSNQPEIQSGVSDMLSCTDPAQLTHLSEWIWQFHKCQTFRMGLGALVLWFWVCRKD